MVTKQQLRKRHRHVPTKKKDDSKNNWKEESMMIKKMETKNKKTHSIFLNKIVVVILTCCCFICCYFLFFGFEKKNTTRHFLETFVCQHPDGYCHPYLQAMPSRRTHITSKSIPKKGTTILKLPKSLLVSDLDALRNPFIQTHFFPQKDNNNNNDDKVYIDSGAYLAIYMCLLCSTNKLHHHTHNKNDDDDRFQPFCNILPSYQDLYQHHPILYTTGEEWWNVNTTVGQLIQSFRNMIQLEYHTFQTRAMASFNTNNDDTNNDTIIMEDLTITYQDYLRMRIHIMSRTFGMGQPTTTTTTTFNGNSNGRMMDEIDSYHHQLGINLTLGIRAISPILDMWNHHHYEFNVDWAYVHHQNAFIVKTNQPISSGQEIIVSYGNYSDSHLLAKFGFVTTPFVTEVNLARHTFLEGNAGLGTQYQIPSQRNSREAWKKQSYDIIQNYFLQDDGYASCIQSNNNNDPSFQFKQLKFQFVKNYIANHRPSWIVTQKGTHIRAKAILNTCRILSLVEQDLDGKASSILLSQEANEKNSLDFIMNYPKDDRLEFRTYHCVARLTYNAMKYYEPLSSKNTNNNIEDSISSDFVQVLQGELETLQKLHQLAIHQALNIEKEVKSKKLPMNQIMPYMYIRKKPCPMKFSLSLLRN